MRAALPNDGRKGCTTFEERVYKLIATNQKDSSEFKIWAEIFGKDKLETLEKKFQELKIAFPQKAQKLGHPDEDGWILVHPDEFHLVRKEDVIEKGSRLPGGAIYVRLKNHAVQAETSPVA